MLSMLFVDNFQFNRCFSLYFLSSGFICVLSWIAILHAVPGRYITTFNAILCFTSQFLSQEHSLTNLELSRLDARRAPQARIPQLWALPP
jgi:hypothetical protein